MSMDSSFADLGSGPLPCQWTVQQLQSPPTQIKSPQRIAHEEFISQVKGKKIRWTGWPEKNWFIPTGVLQDGGLFEGKAQDGVMKNFFINQGFAGPVKESWTFVKEESDITSPISSLKSLYSQELLLPKPSKNPFLKLIKPKGSIMNSVKEYFQEHRGILFTVGLVILADHFVFAGAFREKIKALVEKFLESAHTQVDALAAPKKAIK